MRRTIFLAAILVAAISTLHAQQAKPAPISITPIVAPSTTVLRHSFDSTSSFFDTAINESGEVAFLARWTDEKEPRGGFFTLHRIVAMEGETVDGKYICWIAPQSHLSINAAGEVGWMAWSTTNKNECSFGLNWALALFIDNRFVRELPFDTGRDAPHPFISLSDDGQISVSQSPREVCKPAPTLQAPPQQRGGGFNGIIGAAASAARRGGVVVPPIPPISTGGRPPLPPPALCADPILSMLPFNTKGQFVATINTPAGGGLILLGTKNGR